MSVPWWTEDELKTLGWQWAGDAMKVCEARPDVWLAWVTHANSMIDPAKTTDSKMGRALREFVEANT